MSRLYDSLTEAKRIRRELDAPGEAGLRDGIIPDIQIPPVQTAPGLAEPEAEETPHRTFGRDPIAVPEPYDSNPQPAPNGVHRVSPELNLNKAARLIPHALDSTVLEQYRRLRTKILQKREEKPFRTLLVTSPNPQEGKTLTVLNLGLSFGMLPDFKVLVVDGDLRKGGLAEWLGVTGDLPGLTDLVDGTARLEDVILRPATIPVHFVLRGTARVADAHASQFDVHFRRMAESYDLVIVDSPPVNLLADVQLLAQGCQAVLLVARSFVTSRQALEKAVEDLQSFNVVGTVLNANAGQRSRYYNGYYQGNHD
jgi:capsular exopolysaccharide synthesis family protein